MEVGSPTPSETDGGPYQAIALQSPQYPLGQSASVTLPRESEAAATAAEESTSSDLPTSAAPEEAQQAAPSVPEAQEAEPSAPEAEPSVPEAQQAEPSVPEAQQAEPSATEAQQAEPSATEAQEAEPSATEAQQAAPSVPEAQEAEPSAPEAEPSVPEAQQAEPSVPEAQQAEPSATEAQQAEPSATEAQQAEPSATEAQQAEPSATEAQQAEPSAAEAPTASSDTREAETEKEVSKTELQVEVPTVAVSDTPETVHVESAGVEEQQHDSNSSSRNNESSPQEEIADSEPTVQQHASPGNAEAVASEITKEETPSRTPHPAPRPTQQDTTTPIRQLSSGFGSPLTEGEKELYRRDRSWSAKPGAGSPRLRFGSNLGEGSPSTKQPALTVDEELRKKFSRFANNYLLCHGAAEAIPKALHAAIAQQLLSLSRYTDTEAALLTHMLLIEYLRSVRSKQIHTFMRGNALAPAVIDHFTKATLTSILKPWVDSLVDRVVELTRLGFAQSKGKTVGMEATAVFASPKLPPTSTGEGETEQSRGGNEELVTPIEEAFALLTSSPIVTPTTGASPARAGNGVGQLGKGFSSQENLPGGPADAEPEANPAAEAPTWVLALHEFLADVIRSLARVIDDAVQQPEISPFYSAIAELLRVATIIDRQWAVPQSRFMDSTIMVAYEQAVAANPHTPPPSLGGTMRSSMEDLPAAAASASASVLDTPQSENGSARGLKMKAGVSIANMDLVDSMLATLIMLRVVNPLVASASIALLRKTDLSPEEVPIMEASQRRLMSIAKMLQKAANHRTYDGFHEEHLMPFNAMMPALSSELHGALRHMARHAATNCTGACSPLRRSSSMFGNLSFGSPSGGVAPPLSNATFSLNSPLPRQRAASSNSTVTADEATTCWTQFQATLRSFWIPIVHHMSAVQPLLNREHCFEIDAVANIFSTFELANVAQRCQLQTEISEASESLANIGGSATATPQRRGFLGGLFHKKAPNSAAEQELLHKRDVAVKLRTYCDLVAHGYRRLLRKVKGEPYAIASATGMTRHGCSVLLLYGDNIAAAHRAYQLRATANRMACEKACPSYPHGKHNDFHIAADIAAMLYAATFPCAEWVSKEYHANALPALEVSSASGSPVGLPVGSETTGTPPSFGSSALGAPDTKLWNRRCVIIFIPSTDSKCPLGPNWLFQLLHEIFPPAVLSHIDRVVVTQQATRLSRYAVMLKRLGHHADPASGGGGGDSEDEAEETLPQDVAVRFLFSGTFGEALQHAGLDSTAVALPVALPMPALTTLLRYQEVITWRRRAHRGLYPVLAMLMDSISLMHNYGTRTGFCDSFLSIGAFKALPEFLAQPMPSAHIGRSQAASGGGASPRGGPPTPAAPPGLAKNLIHLIVLNPNNTPNILSENAFLYGLRFCHSISLLFDMYRTENASAPACGELKALPCPSLPHLIDDLKASKARALGLSGARADVDISHELLQLIIFTTLQQHHVSASSEWRERMTQAACELYYRFYEESERKVLEEVAVLSSPSGIFGTSSTDPKGGVTASDTAMWVDVEDSGQGIPVDGSCVVQAVDATVALDQQQSVLREDSGTIHRLRSQVVQQLQDEQLHSQEQYLEAVKSFFARNCNIWEDPMVVAASSTKSQSSSQNPSFSGPATDKPDNPAPESGVTPSQAPLEPIPVEMLTKAEAIFPEGSMLDVVSRRRHVLLYDRFIVESVILLALRAAETCLYSFNDEKQAKYEERLEREQQEKEAQESHSQEEQPKQSPSTTASPTDLPQTGSTADRSGKDPTPTPAEETSPRPPKVKVRPPALQHDEGIPKRITINSIDALKVPNIQRIIRSVQRILFVPSIDWWQQASSDLDIGDPDWDTATFVLTWTLLRHHTDIFGVDRSQLMHGPAYEALLATAK